MYRAFNFLLTVLAFVLCVILFGLFAAFCVFDIVHAVPVLFDPKSWAILFGIM